MEKLITLMIKKNIKGLWTGPAVRTENIFFLFDIKRLLAD
jgi:hypothetical protein